MAYLRSNRLSHLQKVVNSRVLVDRATFSPREVDPVVDDWGQTTTTPQPLRTYEGSTEIPCILYPSRAFEKEELDVQTTVVNRYYLEVPKDFTFDYSDYVTDVASGRKFEIRKVSGVGRFEFTNEIQVSELMSAHDGEES